jgi:hypothetical protein
VVSELPTQVQVLEAQAADAGESSPAGRSLLAQAARLRVQALGERSYPVVVCSECFRVTGWTDAGGLCDPCVRSRQREAAYSDPHGGFVVLGDSRPVTAPAEPQAGPSLVGRLLGGKGARERARVETWMTRVEPDDTGPIAPEEGYELEVAHRDEVEAADGSGMLIRFRPATHRFADGRWVPLETTRIGSRDLLIPVEHAAGLPAEQLVDAWLDYRTAVDELNRVRWSRESGERESRRVARAEHDDALREQRDVLELLDES